ncbi:MAG: hypothetical protein PHF33_05220 [Candidatus Delongbacteria bacterium]|nr:hypothetical protein [Candidatus Delongbacteria bacterium]MDD4205562.1 hypothetical protein [Candidatus Delongbacteria bacterium]
MSSKQGHLDLEYALSILADGTIDGRFHGSAGHIEMIFFKNRDSINNALVELAEFIRENCNKSNNEE